MLYPLSDLLVHATRNSSRFTAKIPGCRGTSWCFSIGARASMREEGLLLGLWLGKTQLPSCFFAVFSTLWGDGNVLWRWSFHKQVPHKFPLQFWYVLGDLGLFSLSLLGCCCALLKRNLGLPQRFLPWSAAAVARTSLCSFKSTL